MLKKNKPRNKSLTGVESTEHSTLTNKIHEIPAFNCVKSTHRVHENKQSATTALWPGAETSSNPVSLTRSTLQGHILVLSCRSDTLKCLKIILQTTL